MKSSSTDNLSILKAGLGIDDEIAVYPLSKPARYTLIPQPGRNTLFICDVHLGKLARLLRTLGFDTFYSNSIEDKEIISISLRQKRIILTRDIGILKHSAVTYAYFIRGTEPGVQIKSVAARFDLCSRIKPFSLCIECNGEIESVPKSSIEKDLEPKTRMYYEEFTRCVLCGRIYWKGSHFERINTTLKGICNN